MFKRNYRRGPRPAGFRRKGPRFARVRKTWIQSVLLDPCDPQFVNICQPPPEAQCCTTRFEQVLVDNQVLQTQFSDRARVVRIVGNVQIMFLTGTASTPQDNYDRITRAVGAMYVQLIKRPINGAGQAELPPDIWDTASVIEGFSESKAMRTWWHFWNPFDHATLQQSSLKDDGTVFMPLGHDKFVDCATGADASLWGALSAGTGAIGSSLGCSISVPTDPIKLAPGDCDYCQLNGLGTLLANTAMGPIPRPWNFRFDIKKRISLREDEQLNLDFQFRSPFGNLYNNGSLVMYQGGIKTLLEY